MKSDWKPGQPLARLSVNGAPLIVKVAIVPMGYRMRLRGADMKVYVRTPRAAELAGLMLEKLPPDTSRYLMCPMPGLLVKLAVAEGDEVEEGQTLATVEAMKMENNLKAERSGLVKKLCAHARRQPQGRRHHPGVRVTMPQAPISSVQKYPTGVRGCETPGACHQGAAPCPT